MTSRAVPSPALASSSWDLEDGVTMSLRTALVVAAGELLDEGGPEHVTLRGVGQRTGVSRTAPYRHFAGKEDLLGTVAAQELAFVVDRMAALLDDGRPALDGLRASAVGYVRWAQERPERFRLVFGRWDEEPDELRRVADRANGLLVEMVRRAQAEGALPAGDPWRLAAGLRALAHGLAVLSQAGHLRGRDRQLLDPAELVEAVLASAWARVPPSAGEV